MHRDQLRARRGAGRILTRACLAAAGKGRYVRVFFPAAYDGTTTFPVWVHLHGVFWTTMGDIATQVSEFQHRAAGAACSSADSRAVTRTAAAPPPLPVLRLAGQ